MNNLTAENLSNKEIAELLEVCREEMESRSLELKKIVLSGSYKKLLNYAENFDINEKFCLVILFECLNKKITNKKHDFVFNVLENILPEYDEVNENYKDTYKYEKLMILTRLLLDSEVLTENTEKIFTMLNENYLSSEVIESIENIIRKKPVKVSAGIMYKLIDHYENDDNLKKVLNLSFISDVIAENNYENFIPLFKTKYFKCLTKNVLSYNIFLESLIISNDLDEKFLKDIELSIGQENSKPVYDKICMGHDCNRFMYILLTKPKLINVIGYDSEAYNKLLHNLFVQFSKEILVFDPISWKDYLIKNPTAYEIFKQFNKNISHLALYKNNPIKYLAESIENEILTIREMVEIKEVGNNILNKSQGKLKL